MIWVNLARSESKIDARPGISGLRVLALMTNWCHAARRVWPEVRTAAQSRTRGKCGAPDGTPEDECEMFNQQEHSMCSDARRGQQRGATGQQLEPWCTRYLAHKRRCCENNIQCCATPMSWLVQRILKNQTVGIHHLLHNWDKGHVGLTSTAKVECREPDVGITGKEQQAPGVALTQSLH